MSDQLPTVKEPAPIQQPPAAPPAGRPASGLKERLAWKALEYGIAPAATRLPYMLGGLTFFGILILIVTGVLLDQFYNPNPVGAHDSVIYIMTRVPFGDWLRGLHYWAATIVLVSVAFHLGWVLWRRSYFRPREVTWWSGVTMLLLLFALVFTGTVLRSDQEGGEALAHAMAAAELVGVLGTPLTPDFARSTTLLARLHNAHVSLLPIALLGLIGLHFWLIRYLGIHAHEPKTHVFTEHLRRLTGYGLLLVAGIGVAAVLFPPGLGHPAVGGAEVTKPFWPFLWIYAAENKLGLWGMIVAPAILFGLLHLVPLVDHRHDDRGGATAVAVRPSGPAAGALPGRARLRRHVTEDASPHVAAIPTMRIGLVVLGLILALGTPALAHEDGVLHLGSRSVAEGAELQVRGEKLPVDAMIRLELRGTLESFLLGEFRTDAAGVFETRLSLPAEAAAGSYTVMAFAPDGDEVARTEIVVLAAPDAGETPGDVGMTPAPGQAGLHATHEMMDLPVTRSWGEWAVILGLIAFGAAVGLALLRGRPTAAGLYAGSED